MDIIKWRSSYETGIAAMDAQHQKLIGLINTMYRVIRKEESRVSVEGVLAEMAEYAAQHLKEEETLLESNEYPDYAEHLAAHRSYVEKMATLMAGWQNDDEAVAKDVYAFLRQWWMGHIVDEDQKYGTFLKAKGVE